MATKRQFGIPSAIGVYGPECPEASHLGSPGTPVLPVLILILLRLTLTHTAAHSQMGSCNCLANLVSFWFTEGNRGFHTSQTFLGKLCWLKLYIVNDRVCFLQESAEMYPTMKAAQTFAFLRSLLRRNNKNPRRCCHFSAGVRGCGELLVLSQYLTIPAPGVTRSLSCHASLSYLRRADSSTACCPRPVRVAEPRRTTQPNLPGVTASAGERPSPSYHGD